MSKNRLRVWPLYTLLMVFFTAIIFFGAYGYYYSPEVIKDSKQVATVVTTSTEKKVFTTEGSWELIYPGAQKMKIKDLIVDVSVAQTWPERIKGLSDTPYLPDNLVKLFIFDTPAFHSIWMKDMHYAIDILWINSDNKIIYIKEDARPESYPDSFAPEESALYVIEANSGFVAKNKISVGDSIIPPL